MNPKYSNQTIAIYNPMRYVVACLSVCLSDRRRFVSNFCSNSAWHLNLYSLTP